MMGSTKYHKVEEDVSTKEKKKTSDEILINVIKLCLIMHTGMDMTGPSLYMTHLLNLWPQLYIQYVHIYRQPGDL